MERERIMNGLGPRVRVPLVLLAALVLQRAFLTDVRVDGIHPDAMLLVAVAAGVAGGAEPGAVVGFLAGMVTDLFLETPLGLSALAFSIVGFAVGTLQASILRAVWWIPTVTALAASAAGVVLFAVMGYIVGQTQLVTTRLPLIAVIVAVANAMLALPAVRLVAWSLTGGAPDRARVR